MNDYIGDTGIEAINQQAVERGLHFLKTLDDVPTNRQVGRPKGTGYGAIDAPLHEKMRIMLEHGEVNSKTAAAKQLADDAYGGGCRDSKVKRLVRSFRS